MSLFETLSKIDCSSKVEQKGGLTYLSWAWAWQILKEHDPLAQMKVYENESGLNYFHDGNTGYVKVGVIASGLEHIEYLPIMDFRNQSIRVEKLTSTDVNKSIQRAATKAIARHGLGLYIYAGEDLPAIAGDLIEKVRELFRACDEKDPDALADFLDRNRYNPKEFRKFNNEQLEKLIGELSSLLIELP